MLLFLPSFSSFFAWLQVIQKASPQEPVGVMAVKDGASCVIEYSELPATLATQTLSPGSTHLLYGSANIAVHWFALPFLERMSSALPYHVANKKIPFFDFATWRVVEPQKPNGIKLEKFIFDVFPRAQRLLAFNTVREEEFSPVKNATGSDSPESARRHVSALHKHWIEGAGGRVHNVSPPASAAAVVGSSPDLLCEVSPLLSYEGEDLAPLVANKDFTLPLHLH